MAVGLLWGFVPTSSYLDIKTALLNGVDTIASLTGKTTTGGRLDVFKALQNLNLTAIAFSPAAGSVVTGTRLLKGKLDVFGITTDDIAAVLDSNGGALAVPISGGPAQPIDPTADMVAVSWAGASSGQVMVRGLAAGGWTDWSTLDGEPGEGPDLASPEFHATTGAGPVWLGPGVSEIQYRVTQGPLPDLQLHAIRSDPTAADAALGGGGGPRSLPPDRSEGAGHGTGRNGPPGLNRRLHQACPGAARRAHRGPGGDVGQLGA